MKYAEQLLKKMETVARRANNVVEEGDISRWVRENYLAEWLEVEEEKKVLAVNMNSIAIAVSVSVSLSL